MLSDLPSEIIFHIATYLPTANALTHLSQTCHRLCKIICADEYRLFRALVQNRFPCTPTPAYWKDAACALTSRSRALDRLGVIGRFVVVPDTVTRIGCQQTTRLDNPTLGYRPAIDSYETWNGSCWADRKEVLAWGAAHQLVLRVKQSGKNAQQSWILFNDVENVSSYEDICSVHLMQPDSGKLANTDTENVIYGRRRGDIIHLAISPSKDDYEFRKKFKTNGLELDRTDVSQGAHSTLSAHFDDGSIAFYNTATEEEEVEAFAWIRNEAGSLGRSRYSKLLSPHRVAMATGEIENSLCISTISPDGVSLDQTINVQSLDIEERINRVHASVTSIATLDTHSQTDSPGNVFLAAWGDHTIRLHDLRSPRSYESTYRDTTDRNLIYCVHPFGNDRFLAGSSGDGLVKMFDLRQGKTYDYLDAQNKTTSIKTNIEDRPSNDFSMFLSANLPPDLTRHIHRAPRRGQQSYRGPIYSMSTPSPSSRTVYTGVVDGLVRLDFASTDDLTGHSKEWYDYNLDLGVEKGQPGVAAPEDQVFRIAGYERPAQDDYTTTSKLRTQHGYWYLMPNDLENEIVTGWDRRWEPLAKPGAWRRRD